MKSIKNKTTTPIRVPLPQGKVLHLGPRKTGQIADHAADHAALKKLIEAGTLEIVEDGAHGTEVAGGAPAPHASTHGIGPNKTVHKSGDR